MMSGTTSKNPFQAYKTTAMNTANPGQIVLMLYDGVIRFCQQAVNGFEFEDIAQRNSHINIHIVKAQNIILELNNNLDHGKGGEIAQNFQQLYEYCERKLHECNMEKTSEGILEVMGHFSGLRSAWSAMLERGGSSMSETEFEAWQDEIQTA